MSAYPLGSDVAPQYNIKAPPPKNESRRMVIAQIARHLAQLLINHMNPIATSIPVKRMVANVFQVFAIF